MYAITLDNIRVFPLYSAGAALEACDPMAFRVGLGDYEGEIQAELGDAIDNEDDTEIEWLDEE